MEIFHNANYDFIRWRWHAIILSLVVILAGAGLMVTRGLPLGIDFSGGTSLVVRFSQDVTLDQGAQRGGLACRAKRSCSSSAIRPSIAC